MTSNTYTCRLMRMFRFALTITQVFYNSGEMKTSCSMHSYRLSIMRNITLFVIFAILHFFFLSILDYVHCYNLLPDEILDFNLTSKNKNQGLLNNLIPAKSAVLYSTTSLLMGNLSSSGQFYHDLETLNRVYFPVFLLTTIILS
jgi:hypothetical protein